MDKLVNIGVLIPNQEGEYYGGLINGICKTANKFGARLFVVQTMLQVDSSIQSRSQYDAAIAWKKMDAWIILPHAISKG